MKKAILYTVIAMLFSLIFLLSSGSFAETSYYTPAEYFEFYQGTISGYTGSDTEVVVPPQINGETVTAIGDNAFGNKSIRSISLPDSIESIGYRAFYNCTTLSEVTIGENVSSMGDSAFYNCTALSELNWNAKNVADFTYNNYVFAYAGTEGDGISVVFGDEVENIPASAFCPYYSYSSTSTYSPKVTSVTIGKNVKSIGRRAFSYCSNLTSIVIPYSVTSIDSEAFYNCTSLLEVTIGENVSSIGFEAFYNCTSLSELNWNAKNAADFSYENYVFAYAGTEGDGISVVFGDEVENIPAYAFGPYYSYSPKVTSVTIGKNVSSIGSEAFYNCTALSELNWNAKNVADFSDGNFVFAYAGTEGDGISVVFGDEVEKIPAYAFCPNSSYSSASTYSPKVTSVTIGKNVSSIGNRAFYNCTALSELNWNAKNVADFTYDNYVFAYAGTEGDGISVVFGDEVENIPAYAFGPYYSYSPKVTSVTIGKNVSSIGSEAFYNCTSLSEVTIGENVSSIGNYAFYNCTSLSELNWNAKNVADFSSSNYVFAYAGTEGDGISVVFGDEVENIPAYVFRPHYSPKVTSVIIGNNVKSIGSDAFSYCSYLTSIVIPDSVTSIGNRAFYNCTALLEITISKNVSSIGSEAFYNCTSLLEVTICENVSSIGNRAFYNCTALLEITISKNVSSIGNYAFYNCTALSELNWNAKNVADFSSSNYVFAYAGTEGDGISVVFGDEVESIPAYAFYPGSSSYSPKVTSVSIGKNVTRAGNYAFSNLGSLESINIPAKLTTFPENTMIGWENIKTISVDANHPYYSSDEYGVLYNNDKSVLLRYPSKSEADTFTIPNSVDHISNEAFYHASNLAELTLNHKLTAIGNDVFVSVGKDGALKFNMGKDAGLLPSKFFYTMEALTEINVSADNSTYSSENGVLYSKDGSKLEQYPPASMTEEFVVGNNVTEIADYAFYNSKALTTITIGEKVSEIGDYAFYNSKTLTTITIGEKVSEIGDCAFYNCTSLTQIYWNAENVKNFSYYNDEKFGYAGTKGDGINVVFGDSVKTIPDYIFNSYYSSRNPKVISISIGSGVETIPSTAFSACASIEKITFGENIKYIGSGAFSGTAYHKNESNWENNLLYLNNCLIAARSVSGVHTVKDGTRLIAGGVFENCTNLSGINIPEGVKYIGGIAFYGCSGLKAAPLPESLLEIGSSAFYGCSSIVSLTIPVNVSSVGNSAFYNCTSLTDITWNAKSVADFSSGSNVFGNAGKNGSGINVVFGDETEAIPSYMFVSSNILSVHLGSSVKYIGDRAFYGCSGLKAALLPESLLEIGSSAFYGCSSIVSLTIPVNVSSVGNSAFYNCTSLTDITWNAKSVADFSSGSNVFGNAGKNGSGINVVFGDETEAIPSYIFISSSYPANILSVHLGSSVKSIGSSAFYACSGITSLEVPESITDIGASAFYNCVNLNSVYITNLEKYMLINFGDIYADPAYYASSVYLNGEIITDVVIPDGVSTIPTFVKRNSLIESLTIPGSVETIENTFFKNCTNLKNIVLKDGITSIGQEAFYNCSSLESLTVPQSVKTVGSNAFYGLAALKELNWNATEISEPEYYYNENAIFTNAGANSTGVAVIFGYGVKVIPSRMFYVRENSAYTSNIISVSLSNTITSIGDYAFCGCSAIKSLTIPESLTEIGRYVFYDLTSLKELNWNAIAVNRSENYGSESVFRNVCANGDGLSVVFGEKVQSIPAYMFYCSTYGDYVSNLKSVVISDSVTSVGDYAFYNCGNISELTFGSGITDIGNEAFFKCKGITDMNLPDSLVNIGREAFSGCTSVISLAVPENVEYIGYNAFFGLSSLENLLWNVKELPEDGEYVDSIGLCHAGDSGNGLRVVFGDKVKKIPERIFSTNNYEDVGANIISVLIPGNVEEIGGSAFYNCKKLSDLSIAEGVKKVGNYAFYGCEALTELAVPESIIKVGYDSFGNLTSVTKLTWNPVRVTNTDDDDRCSFYNIGANTDGVEVIFGDHVEKIPDCMFNSDYYEDKAKVTSVYMSDSIKEIGYQAFYNCTGLTELTIGKGVEYIGSYAFDSCTSLKTLTIPEGLKTADYDAFSECTSLELINWNAKNFSVFNYEENSYHRIFEEIGTNGNGVSIIFGDSVESISPYLFSDCTAVKNVSISDSVKTIGIYAFESCSALENISIGNGVEHIDYYAFYGTALYNNGSNWDNNVLYIDNYLIEAKRGLRGDYSIRPGTRAIADNAFSSGRITAVNIPDSVVSIGDNAFRACTSLKKVNIPDSVRYLGSYAFYENEYITEAKIGRGINCIDESTFANCWDLQLVTIPKSVTHIKANAFSGDSYITYVEYGGSDDEWNKITIETGNDYLKNASFKYNRELPVTVFYNVNGGINAPDVEKANENSSIIITSSIPSREGYTFLGWSENSGATTAEYICGDTLSIGTKDVTLYAVWKLIVDFDVEYTNGIIVVVPTRIPVGSSVAFALYKDGILSGFDHVVFDGNSYVIPFSPDCEFDTVKLMVWDKLTSLVPLCTEKLPDVGAELTAFQIMGADDF